MYVGLRHGSSPGLAPDGPWLHHSDSRPTGLFKKYSIAHSLLILSGCVCVFAVRMMRAHAQKDFSMLKTVPPQPSSIRTLEANADL